MIQKQFNEDNSERRTYSAGSFSHDPRGFRKISTEDSAAKIRRILEVFPELSALLSDRLTVINAYPASLGLEELGISVDNTALRPTTMIRAFRRAANEGSSVVFAAQPLLGADQLLKFCEHRYALPAKILWASGGYYLPRSLETFIRQLLASKGCDLHVLHCYGVAEVGHTCFAALERFDSGLPNYQLVDDRVSVVDQEGDVSRFFELASDQQRASTGDWICRVGDGWQIASGPSRLAAEVLSELESWNSFDWSRRTGYLRATRNPSSSELEFKFQLREPIRFANDHDTRFHEFWQEYGGDFASKPNWSITSSR